MTKIVIGVIWLLALVVLASVMYVTGDVSTFLDLVDSISKASGRPVMLGRIFAMALFWLLVALVIAGSLYLSAEDKPENDSSAG